FLFCFLPGKFHVNGISHRTWMSIPFLRFFLLFSKEASDKPDKSHKESNITKEKIKYFHWTNLQSSHYLRSCGSFLCPSSVALLIESRMSVSAMMFCRFI